MRNPAMVFSPEPLCDAGPGAVLGAVSAWLLGKSFESVFLYSPFSNC